MEPSQHFIPNYDDDGQDDGDDFDQTGEYLSFLYTKSIQLIKEKIVDTKTCFIIVVLILFCCVRVWANQKAGLLISNLVHAKQCTANDIATKANQIQFIRNYTRNKESIFCIVLPFNT